MKRVQFNSPLLPYLFVLPQMAIIVIFFYWPSVQAIQSSFYLEDPFGFSASFVGLDNYLDALTSMLSESNDKTLQELAQVMTDSASKANPALTDTQLSQMRSQLTTGLEEMRAQLKQGHQPASPKIP